MPISRTELAKMLTGVENAEEIINYVMAENGKQINSLRAENEDLKTKLLDAGKAQAEKEKEFAAYKDSVKDFETFKKENEELKSQVKGYETKEKEKAYFDELTNIGVDEKFKKFVFSEVKPNENESVEDYNKRVNEYMEKNVQFKSENFAKVNTQLNFKNQPLPDFSKMSDEEYLVYRNQSKNK